MFLNKPNGRYCLRGRSTLPDVTTAISESDGQLNISNTFDEPGQALGDGALDHYLRNGAALLSSVGRRAQAYLAGQSHLPKLNLAWCDAAYWFHEGLAEPLETIAVPKLETAIEVLFRSENSRGSERRMLAAIRGFYDLGPNQAINPTSPITVRQFVKGFVRDRSRILHGTWSTLMRSLRDTRPNLTWFVRGLLASYTLELEAYDSTSNTVDSIEGFLDWVQSQRQAQSP